jgi:hypothetical protein
MRLRVMGVGVAGLVLALGTLLGPVAGVSAKTGNQASGPLTTSPTTSPGGAPARGQGGQHSGPVHAASPGQVVHDLTSGATANGMASILAGPGVSVSNATFTGNNQAGGTFSGFAAPLGFDSGVVLSSGKVTDAVGPNTVDKNTTVFGTPGDPTLTALAGFPTFDAAALQFQFVPQGNQATFKYVFGSEEYNEFANTEFNDVFGFFVNGNDLAHDCATVAGAPVSINTINGGNPLGTNPKNPSLYRNNENGVGPTWSPGPLDIQADGLTVVLTCTVNVNPGVVNTLRLALADGSDARLDSWVFIQAGSLSSPPSAPAPTAVVVLPRFTG